MSELVTLGWIVNAAQEAASFPFYAAGWLAGVAVRMIVWCRDAIIAGYERGRAKDEYER